MRRVTLMVFLVVMVARQASAGLITNPNDPRVWQSATVGTFAQLYFGANNATTRQMVVDQQLLDDGIFNATGYLAGTLVKYNGAAVVGPFGTAGRSLDLPGADPYDGSYAYDFGGGHSIPEGANAIDNLWIQQDNVVGHTVWDLGFQASKAAIFNTIDHGPLPYEAIESTVYLSNDQVSWTQAVVQRVWLEGFMADTGIQWDGFTFAVGTGTSATFRYASIIWGGPGALQSDGDDEINGVMGLRADFNPNPVPEPASMLLFAVGAATLGARARRRTN